MIKRPHLPRSVRGLSRPNGRRPQLVDVREGNHAWLADRVGACEASVSRWGIGFGTAGAVRWSQRVDVTSASPALASRRCRSMAR